MIRLDHVTKYYPTRRGRHFVLKDVSLDIPTRINIGVLGANGAGKTTLMRMLAGVDIPNRGRITRNVGISWPMGIAQGLQASMTGRENARFVCRIQGLVAGELGERLGFIHDFADIGEYFEMPVRTYSAGMRARLNFAISMAFDFDCYIVDELTAVGDQAFREKSARIFREKRDRASFIKVSHNIEELRAECDAGLVLHDGNLHFFPQFSEAARVYRRIIAPDR